MKIAIIGSGISGLGAAYLLAPHHDITVYEKNAYIGGHSRTVVIECEGKQVPVDTGFIVFNNWNYPNLMGLFNKINVPYEKSDMSFGVSINNGWLEYSSNDLLAGRNLKRLSYWGMLKDIVKFNRAAPAYLEKDPQITLGECLHELKMGDWFKDYYLLAMGAAIWSCPLETILKFPAQTFVRFFQNHGLLNINKRPQWYSVKGGSREYVSRLTASFHDKIKLNCGVKSVTSQGDKWDVIDETGEQITYDHIIFACHADEAMAILGQNAPAHLDFMKAFTYQENRVVLHRDKSFMPTHKKCWSSWVYLSEHKKDTNNVVSLSYWMNNLQPLDTDIPIIVTLNPGRRPKDDLIFDEHVFSHPVFDGGAIAAQEKMDTIQGQSGLWFCGAYQRYGFHEDGLLSAVKVAQKMGVEIPWQ